MKTTALRLYGKNDLRLEQFELPKMRSDELCMEVIVNSICMSTYKLVNQGNDHKRVSVLLAKAPIILGHEFCGRVIAVGEKWKSHFDIGQKCAVQPMIGYPGREHEALGHSFPYAGGHATKVIISREILEMNCLIPFESEGFFRAALAEPVSCVIGAFNTQYHYAHGSYKHDAGIMENGCMAILGGGGPMGLCAIDYALHGADRPDLLVVTDLNSERLKLAESTYSQEHARACGVQLHYICTDKEHGRDLLMGFSENRGYDDVFVFAPVPVLAVLASSILCGNGCLNFFAGPEQSTFSASINFYDVHYNGHHVVGSSGGNADDLHRALQLIDHRTVDPAVMVTHIGGLNAASETITTLPKLTGGKKLIYTNIDLPLTAISSLSSCNDSRGLFKELATITKRHNGIWSFEAEQYLLDNVHSKSFKL